MADIPVLDLAPALFGMDINPLADEFARAYGDLGFAYVENHGIDEALIYAIFEANRVFHDQPPEAKMAVALNALHRGYIPFEASTDVTSELAEVTKPNLSESFMMMREDVAPLPGAYLSGPNQWPDLKGFRNICETYHAALCELGQRLLQIALRACGADMQAGMAGFETPTTWLRLLHYPPRPEAAADDLYGSAPHVDFGALTILAQDNVGGLEVQTPEGDWIAVPPRPGSFIVNVGGMLNRMSNGRLRATPHRVINPEGAERYSVAFFYDPHVSTLVAPLPGTDTPRFEPLHFGDFLQGELGASYERHKA
jgi:isopenicillin N synthase-like dioxygenase